DDRCRGGGPRRGRPKRSARVAAPQTAAPAGEPRRRSAKARIAARVAGAQRITSASREHRRRQARRPSRGLARAAQWLTRVVRDRSDDWTLDRRRREAVRRGWSEHTAPDHPPFDLALAAASHRADGDLFRAYDRGAVLRTARH